MNDRLTDELISVMKQILSELHGIRGALHPCEHVFEHKTHAEPCDCRADRLVDGCWLCETHAKIVEDWEKKPKRT